MKVTIERSVFLKALSHTQSVVEKRNTIPILSNVLLQAGEGRLSLTATDLDMEIVESAPADVAVEGAATAPAHTLYEIVRRLPDGAQARLDLSGDDPRLKLSAGRSDFALSVLPSEDFPILPADDLGVNFTVPAAELARLIDKTRFAISTEETRYYLNGVFLHPHVQDDGGVLRVVATDGHRLARVDTDLPEGAADMPGVIVPRKAVVELRRLLEDAEDQVQVSASDAKIRFSFGDVVLTSKLIDGSFPDYSRVF
ncbi:MAG: DNA polymerase III subunit beta, partial [Pseudomonadota bacterium]